MSSMNETKERHYAHLAGRLAVLSQTLQNTQHHFGVAADQATYLRQLGTNQAALFMAALNLVDQSAEDQDPSADQSGDRDPQPVDQSDSAQ